MDGDMKNRKYAKEGDGIKKYGAKRRNEKG